MPKEEQNEEKKSMIFLQDNTIIHRALSPEEAKKFWYAHNQISTADGSTIIKEFIGFDVLRQDTSKYIVTASAIKYLASISHLGKNFYKSVNDKPSEEPHDEIFFSGGITIFEKAEQTDANLKLYDFAKQGIIWTSRPVDKKFYESNGLKLLLFDNGKNEDETIDAIINGLDCKDDEIRSEQIRREHEAYRNGTSDRRYSDFD